MCSGDLNICSCFQTPQRFPVRCDRRSPVTHDTHSSWKHTLPPIINTAVTTAPTLRTTTDNVNLKYHLCVFAEMLFGKQECNRNNPRGWNIRAITVRFVGCRMRIQCYCQQGPLSERLGKHQCGHMWPCAATRVVSGKQGDWLMTNNKLQTSDVWPKNLLRVGNWSQVTGAGNIRLASNPHWTPHDILRIIQRNTTYDPSKTLLIIQF